MKRLRLTAPGPRVVPGIEREVMPGEIIELPEKIIEEFELLNGQFELVEPKPKPKPEPKKEKGGRT